MSTISDDATWSPVGDLTPENLLPACAGGEPVRTEPFGPRWLFDERERAQLDEVMQRAPRSWRSGFKVKEFSRGFAATIGVSHAVPAGSCTGAIHAAIGALDFEPGDEILTTPVTDIGSVIGILMQNLVPVFADWDPETFNTDPSDIERKITERTRAILVVHLFGNPCPMGAIMRIARRHRLMVIEDCAQALLAESDGIKVGGFGDVSCFSFGLKTLSMDQGGMALTNDAQLATRIRGFLSKGSEKVGTDWIPYSRLGAFYPMTDLQAAVGIAQLEKLEDATRIRERTARIWDQAFSDLRGFRIPKRAPGDRPTHYLYPYHIDPERAGVDVEGFVHALRAEGISDAFGRYLKGRPLHLHPMLRDQRTYGSSGFPLRDANGIPRIDYRAQRLPVAEDMLPHVGFFHLRNTFTAKDASDIAAAIRKVAMHYARHPLSTVQAHPAPPSTEESPPPATESVPAPAPVERPSPRDVTASDAVMHAPGGKPPLPGVIDLGSLDADNTGSSAKANDRAFAQALSMLSAHGGIIRIPQGQYAISRPITLEKLRNVAFIGDGGNTVQYGTRILYRGDGPGHCLELVTAVHCRFTGIELVADSPACSGLLSIRAAEDGPSAISTLSIDFEHCVFRIRDSATGSSAGISMRDCANIGFRQCWFKTHPGALVIGSPIRAPAPTISNGLCANIQFDNCQFFSDVLGERGSAIAFRNCQFAAKPDGFGSRIDMSHGQRPAVQAVSIESCFAIAGHGAPYPFFTQGAGGTGLSVRACRISGYRAAVAVNGRGAASICANLFAQTDQGACDISVAPGARDVEAHANDSRATTGAGNTAVVGIDRGADRTASKRLVDWPSWQRVRRKMGRLTPTAISRVFRLRSPGRSK